MAKFGRPLKKMSFWMSFRLSPLVNERPSKLKMVAVSDCTAPKRNSFSRVGLMVQVQEAEPW